MAVAAELVAPERCIRCARPPSALCRRCAALLPGAGGAPIPGVRAAVVVWAYDAEARALVLALKAGARRGAGTALAAHMAAAAAAAGVGAELVAWVPGRPADARRRGFDHAEVLARAVARHLGLPAAGLVRRIRGAPDQVGLGAVERRRNLAGAFRAAPVVAPVLLVDDVVTTGATAAACARALRAAGAPHVDLLAACRA